MGLGSLPMARRLFPCRLHPATKFPHEFWIASVDRPLLGADFFHEKKMCINFPSLCLVDTVSGRNFLVSLSPSPSVSGLHIPPSGPYEEILESFPDLPSPVFNREVKHKVQHFTPTRGPPLHARPRRLDGEKLSVAKEEFKKMEEMGIICHSDSPWASPLHVVPRVAGGHAGIIDDLMLSQKTTDILCPISMILTGSWRECQFSL